MRMIGAVLTASALLLAGGYAARMLSLRVSLLEKICIMLRVVGPSLNAAAARSAMCSGYSVRPRI